MTTILIIILSILTCVFAFTTFNLLKKNEKQEDIIESQSLFISNFAEVVEFSSSKLAEIDAKGSFQSDDEIGWFFDNVKSLQVMLNQFLTNDEINNEKNKETKI